MIWTGYAAAPYTGFTGLLDGQATLQSQLQTWLADPIEANLPVIYAEQLMRGNRVDVYTYSEASPDLAQSLRALRAVHLRSSQ